MADYNTDFYGWTQEQAALPVEGWTVKPLMVRQAHHERLNLKLFRLKWVTDFLLIAHG